jgi:hypothetical protein
MIPLEIHFWEVVAVKVSIPFSTLRIKTLAEGY